MKTTEEKIAVMQAYADGKKIEFHRYDDIVWKDVWCEVKTPIWDWVLYDYRIKKEPTYRPYESVNEMLDDFCERCREHGMTVSRSPMGEPFIWLLSKDEKNIELVTRLDKGDLNRKDTLWLNGYVMTFQAVFENYTYKDGSPCGKKVEE